jgi:hypothetical protein
MVKVKEMPYSEKYAKVMDTLKFEETHLYPYIQKSLGNQAAADLKKMIQNVSQPIREDAPFEEKYRTAYSNWVLSGCTSFKFIRTSLGDEGIERLIRADVDALKQENAGIALSILNIVRFFSPGTAFSMTVKNMVYQLQWLGEYEVPEMSKTSLVLNIPHCDILDYPNNEDVCQIGCQRIYPLWVAEQLKANMRFNRQGKSCKMTLTPIK